MKLDPKYGPVIDATVSVLGPLGTTVKIRALLVTGCNRTWLDSSVIAALQIAPVGSSPVITTMGATTRPLYKVRVQVADIVVDELVVSEDTLERTNFGMGPEIQGLIGMDVISRGILTVYGPDGEFLFHPGSKNQ